MTDKLNSSPDFPWLSDGTRVVDWSTMLINRLRQEFGFNALRSNTLLPGDNPVRIVLVAATTFYVATTGSNSNNGLTAATPWLTIQHAIDVLSSTYDFGNQLVTVQIADGTYAENITVAYPWVGGAQLTLKGNVVTPANVIISPAGGNCISVGLPSGGGAMCFLTIGGMTLVSSNANAIVLQDKSSLVINAPITLGACASSHFVITRGATVFIQTPTMTISGSAGVAYIQAGANAIFIGAGTTTLTGTPNFGVGLLYCVRNATIIMTAPLFSGAGTGRQYVIQSGAIIDGGARGTSWLPTGLTAGSTDGTAFFI